MNLSLSHSAVITYLICKRRYFWRTHWANSRSQDPGRKLAAALKDGTSPAAYAGKIVHSVAARLVRRLHAGDGWPFPDTAAEWARSTVDRDLRAAATRTLETATKERPMLIDSFYGADPERLTRKIGDAAEKAARLVRNLWIDERLSWIAAPGGPLRLLNVESLVSWPLDVDGVEVPIWIVPDVAILGWRPPEASGQPTGILVIDWKTGKPRVETDQLALYGAWAAAGSLLPVAAVAVYLEDGRTETHHHTPEHGAAVLARLRAVIDDIRPRLVDGDLRRNEARRGPGHADVWPQLPEGSDECRWCDYRRLCRRDQ